MKLITGYLDSNLSVLREDVQLSPSAPPVKKTFIEGVFMQAEKENRNRRIYPKAVLEFAVDRYNKEQVLTGRAVGELNHPEGPSINLDKVSHRIVKLEWNGDDVVGKALILDTPMGRIVEGLLAGGVKLGVSSRGVGSVLEKRTHSVVKNDLILSAVDVVQDPSAPSAFVNGIMEGVDFFFQNGKLVASAAEKARTRFSKMTKSQIAEAQAREFHMFLSELTRK